MAYLSVRMFTLATMDRDRRVSCESVLWLTCQSDCLLWPQWTGIGECLVAYLSVRMFTLATMDRDRRVSCEPLVAYLSVRMFPQATMDRDRRVSCGLFVSQNVYSGHNGQG